MAQTGKCGQLAIELFFAIDLFTVPIGTAEHVLDEAPGFSLCVTNFALSVGVVRIPEERLVIQRELAVLFRPRAVSCQLVLVPGALAGSSSLLSGSAAIRGLACSRH